MPDYDVVVIGAGHNGLATATVLRRAGLSVLCLEKNRYVGGMCSTVELFDGYKFEIAGSTMFPLSQQVVDDLQLHAHGFEPIEHEVMSCNIGDPGARLFISSGMFTAFRSSPSITGTMGWSAGKMSNPNADISLRK